MVRGKRKVLRAAVGGIAAGQDDAAHAPRRSVDAERRGFIIHIGHAGCATWHWIFGKSSPLVSTLLFTESRPDETTVRRLAALGGGLRCVALFERAARARARSK